MKRVIWLAVGLFVGIAATVYLRPEPQPVWAGTDRHEDYVMCTGPVMIGPNLSADGVWILDYRAGKLLGTMIDRNLGKVVGWAEVDLVKEFNIPPKQNVHFMMTTGAPLGGNMAGIVAGPPTPAGPTPAPPVQNGPPLPGNPPKTAPNAGGNIAFANLGIGNQGTATLYLTEVNTGRFGVYTMAPRIDGVPGMIIRRHDATLFRQPVPQ